jgi:solute:Na+ symporter, SSS family
VGCGLFSNDPIIYGLLTSLVVFVVVSLLTRPMPSRERAAWERRMRRPLREE